MTRHLNTHTVERLDEQQKLLMQALGYDVTDPAVAETDSELKAGDKSAKSHFLAKEESTQLSGSES